MATGIISLIGLTVCIVGGIRNNSLLQDIGILFTMAALVLAFIR